MAKVTDKEYKTLVQDACRIAAICMEDRIEQLSWFGKNHKKKETKNEESK